jgi:phage terminase large subunit-like protein
MIEVAQYPDIYHQLGMSDGLDKAKLTRLVASLDEEETVALMSDWDLWSLPYQKIPEGDWRRWIFRAGRGTGKTHTGARTTNEVARDRWKIKTGEIGIIGRTYSDARHTMVEGPSGILAQAPFDFKPVWEPGNGVLVWPNGVRGRIFTADKPEQMRGPNWAWVWADEPAHWPDFEKTWSTVIEPALRIGWARCMLTTTPIPNSYLKELEGRTNTVVSRASTFQNGFLPPAVIQALKDQYAGTRVGRQELGGEYLEDNERALWKAGMFDDYRVDEFPRELERVVVAVDPAVSSNENSDETGMVVMGRDSDGHGYLAADRSGTYTPSEWARKAVAAYHRFNADAIVCEVNNGGDLVEANIHAEDDRVNVIKVHASRGKFIRAEPAAAMYEREKIHHCGHFPELEDQCTNWDPTQGKSPDRLDALVWAIHNLFLKDNNIPGPISAYLN